MERHRANYTVYVDGKNHLTAYKILNEYDMEKNIIS